MKSKFTQIRLMMLVSLLMMLVLQACDMFESHPYDGNIKGERKVNVKNIERIEKECNGKTTLRFAFISDTQRWFDETDYFVKALNKRTDIDFVIHGGDIADFGLTKEYTMMRDILNKLKVPYVVILGNHDCLANGDEIFLEVFGPVNYSFLAGNTKFICLNTNALEFDYSHSVPDFKFMEQEALDNRGEYEKTVVAMHVRPFADQFNNNASTYFQQLINGYKNLQFCIYGHGHQLVAEDVYGDGVMYYQVSNIEKRKYLVFTLKPDNTYDYEIASF